MAQFFMLQILKKSSELTFLKVINKYRPKSNQVDIVYINFQKHSKKFFKKLFTKLNYNWDLKCKVITLIKNYKTAEARSKQQFSQLKKIR